ncbi:MAG TPA: DUF192 domain-containing protein [Anaerolineae bacterium]|jgi:uncharacterized membrane protein (UPF0127 family)|nr:DUF192 domain-containing protein [Anaerolineae bacterium]
MSEIKVTNLSTGAELVTVGRLANTHWSRLRGLMGSRPLAPLEGLLIVPCKSIHTHFMRFPIDVLFVNEAEEVIGLHHSLPPWRLGESHANARFVVELPAGTLASTGTQVGHRLRVEGLQTP